MTITGQSSLAKDDIERMVRDAEAARRGRPPAQGGGRDPQQRRHPRLPDREAPEGPGRQVRRATRRTRSRAALTQPEGGPRRHATSRPSRPRPRRSLTACQAFAQRLYEQAVAAERRRRRAARCRPTSAERRRGRRRRDRRRAGAAESSTGDRRRVGARPVGDGDGDAGRRGGPRRSPRRRTMRPSTPRSVDDGPAPTTATGRRTPPRPIALRGGAGASATSTSTRSGASRPTSRTTASGCPHSRPTSSTRAAEVARRASCSRCSTPSTSPSPTSRGAELGAEAKAPARPDRGAAARRPGEGGARADRRRRASPSTRPSTTPWPTSARRGGRADGDGRAAVAQVDAGRVPLARPGSTGWSGSRVAPAGRWSEGARAERDTWRPSASGSRRTTTRSSGSPTTATDKEITSAYRKLAKQYHPDANPGSEDASRRSRPPTTSSVTPTSARSTTRSAASARWPEASAASAAAAGAPAGRRQLPGRGPRRPRRPVRRPLRPRAAAGGGAPPAGPSAGPTSRPSCTCPSRTPSRGRPPRSTSPTDARLPHLRRLRARPRAPRPIICPRCGGTGRAQRQPGPVLPQLALPAVQRAGDQDRRPRARPARAPGSSDRTAR